MKQTGLFLRTLFLCTMFFVPACLFAQSSITGTVLDETGEGVIGASVLQEGTTNGTITDFDGNFTLNCPEGAILNFSYVGYQPQSAPAKNGMVITLREDSEQLEEVVVVGYGSLSKKEVSSSVVQVNKDQFNQGAVSDAMGLVAGKIAGLNVSSTSDANPNAMNNIQVRGATSLSASNDPLVVIDGIAGGDLRNLAAQDIESITVLKDAGSAAIYGTRGANGVILVTTKKGSSEEGRVSITYDGYAAINMAKPHSEVLSPDEFRRSRRGMDYGANTDWYSLITRKVGYTTNHYLSLDATTKGGYYGGSISWKRGNGLDLSTGRNEYGARFRMEQYALDRRLQFSASLSARKVHEDWGNDGLFDAALSMNPTMPVYNEDGSFYQPTSPQGAVNPVAEVMNNTNNGDRVYLLGNAEAKWNILKLEEHSLSTSFNYAVQYNDLESHSYAGSKSADSYWNKYNGNASIRYEKWLTNRIEWLGNYQMSIGEHDLKVVVGYSWERADYQAHFQQNYDFDYDQLLWYGIGNGSYLADGLAGMWAARTESTLIGFFGRANYNWRNMLFVSASIRYEGSTKFGVNNKWGAFPSASIAWEMMSAEFMAPAKSVVNSLKPRVSYGVTGRSDFAPYQSAPSYTANGYAYIDGAWVKGYAFASNANPDLRWERSTSLNVGVDFEMLQRKLRGSVEFFDRRSPDLLYNYNAPQPPYVYPNILVNVGTTKNLGVELSVEYDVLHKSPVKWTTGINYSWGVTRLEKLSDDLYEAPYVEFAYKGGQGSSEYFFRVQEGSKIAQFYGYKYAGSINGDMLVYNKDGYAIPVGSATADDKQYIGNGMPEHFLSWNNTLRWKWFDLSLQFRGAFGFDIFNMRRYGMGLKGAGTANVLRSAYLDDKDVTTGGGVISSFFLEKGDYFKLDNVTLGYTYTPNDKKLLESVRVYLNAKNLFTLTKYSGTDPSNVPSTGLEPGIDYSSAYPTSAQLSLGLTVKFH